jgi:hypothetical protein
MTLPDFQMPVAADEHDRKLLSDVARHGWHVLHVFDPESDLTYSFSVGLYLKFGHPEILVMGLSEEVSRDLINTTAEHIAGGRVFLAGTRTDDLVEGFACGFTPILVDHYEQYLGYGIWFYRSLKQPFPAIQLVWPDKQGRFPWEENYDKNFLRLQHLLDTVSP